MDGYASPELLQAVNTTWRGYVDHWDPFTGITGWALAADEPQRPIVLELLVGSAPFDVTKTSNPRPDIDRILGVRVTAGFCFKASIFARLAQLPQDRRDLAVTVRIAGTTVQLPPLSPSVTVGKLIDSWKIAMLAKIQDREPQFSSGERLLLRLADMRAQAERFRDLPLRPRSEMEVGHIDSVYLASEGQVWLVGWMKSGYITEFPAMIVDRKKYSAATSVVQFHRPDLPSHSVGVIGVVVTDWVPPIISSEFFIYIGENAQDQLRADQRTSILDAQAFLATWNQVRAVPMGGHIEAIASVLSSGSQWMPGNAVAAGIASEAAIDQLLMLPGFGCIAEGWAVSPAKRVQSFQLKIGDCVMVAEPSSTYFKPRPDLTSAFGGRASITERAGFVTVFRGALQPTTTGVPLLRVIHDDGTSVVHALDAKILQLLDPMSDSTDILRLYPGLEHEAYYPAFLEAISRRLAMAVRDPVGLMVSPVQKVVVLRLPKAPNNIILSIDRIAGRAEISNPEIGICLLTDKTQALTEAKLLLNELRNATSASLSLFCLEDAAEGFNEIPLILAKLGAEQFVYVGRGLLLTSVGWHYAVKSLANSRDSIDYFQIVDDCGSADRIYGAFSAACFGWSTAALLEWRSTAPHFVGGVFGKSGLPEGRNAHFRRTGAAMRLERPRPSRLSDMLNQDLINLHQNAHRGA